ncbi:MAG: 4Fe-4S binding protein [Anaerolineae bacterium]|nr:4Fe-4S binding protein [Anaerolineae bacterium]
MPLIDPERCTHCGLCVKGCPTQALGHVGDRIAVVNPEACTYCGQCEQLCPENAIALPYQIVMQQAS